MEKWREIYTDDSIKILQKLELKNLKELDRICNILNINFFAYGGTLIGAIRHNGFIPWDDDIDVAMMRDDYIKFVKFANNYISENFYLQTMYLDKNTPYSYTKIRLKNTKCIEYEHHKLNIEKGIYIDIYPIDFLPNDDNLFYKQYKKFHKYTVLYAWRQCPYCSKNANFSKKIINYIISKFLKIVPRNYLIKKIDNIATAFNNTKTNRMGNLYYPKPVNIFKSIFPLKKVKFEDTYINIPNDWEGYLKLRYGDYMKMPPVEKRIGHKPYLLDFGNYFNCKEN